MPRRTTRSKLSRRRVAQPPRPYSPELPWLLPPLVPSQVPAPAPAPAPAEDGGHVVNGAAPASPAWNGASVQRPVTTASAGEGDAADGAARSTPTAGEDEARPVERPLLAEDVAKRPHVSSSSSEEDDALLLARPAASEPALAEGDVVWAKYRGEFHPALVMRLTGKTASVKYVYDLVMHKRSFTFKVKVAACRPFTHAEKQLHLQAAAVMKNPEEVRLAVEAVEALLVCDTEDADDPEKFFLLKCDYIVRLRSGSASPIKSGAAAPPVARPPPLRRFLSPSVSEDEDEDEEDEDELLDEPPQLAPLDEHLREEQRAYAARLLEQIRGQPCRDHLSAVHAGRAPCWRRQAFARGQWRRLLHGSGTGDLCWWPELAVQAMSEVQRVTAELPAPPAVQQRRYADEVLLPEAIMFAMAALSGEPRSADELEAELARGAPRFQRSAQ